MDAQNLEIKVSIQVSKPVHETFEAVADPAQITNYWISKTSGRLENDVELLWGFPEFEGEFPVQMGKVAQDELITFYWDAYKGGKHVVEMKFSGYKGNTVVEVTEKPTDGAQPGLDWLTGNTEGWANFLACLKAWVEYGINLRKGAFDYRFDAERSKA